jgi:centrosomal protein CEP44
MSQGTPTAFLPIYHYLFTNYSHAIAEMISSSDTELFGKTDFRFIEAVYKVCYDFRKADTASVA